MRKIILLSLVLLCSTLVINAQRSNQLREQERLDYNNNLGTMSQTDSAYLSGLPELPVPDIYRGPNAPLMPYALDNSTQDCFRPAYNQAGYSCGQAALVGYNYTYEINRVRELPGNLPDNQYTTHFTWNFWNAGNQYGGVSYFTSMEIMKYVGNPNVTDYGGMATGGEKRWMTGYNNYYNAMHNRITTGYSMNVGTPEGIESLKHYLHDHLEGSEVGGLASFYANQPSLNTLAYGTPEGGKRVVVSWSYSNHALTIVGWNDSIRWDYNNDGQYTNDLDINNDGVVNVKDWEIGGFKLVNSYGGVPNWGDEGFAYMMYKSVADEYGSGGIWNNTVNTVKVKEDCDPQLTMKIKLKHSRRKAVKVMAGFSTDINATEPEQLFDFPIFNFQGGDNYMQGGSTEEDKTIEFGLDISHFLSYLEPGEETKFFLRITEHDPESWGSGEYISFSIIDYTNGVFQVPCSESNILIPHNGTVTVSVNHTVNHEEINIDSGNLPSTQVGVPYNYQLNASGGSSPYFWSIDFDYDETSDNGDFPTVNANQLTPSNNDNGVAVQAIDFSFPFYGTEYNNITVHTDGFLKFDDDLYQWPYIISSELLFKKTALIAPYMSDLTIYPAQGDGIWYEGDETGAIFYWKTSVNGQATQTELNFAVKLFPDGDIKFYYGDVNTNGEIQWYGGTSKGNSLDYQFTATSGKEFIANNSIIDFGSAFYPSELALSEDGILSGTPLQDYTGNYVKFRVTDNNNIFSKKAIQFSSNDISIEPTIISGDDDRIEFGENVMLSIALTNNSVADMVNTSMNISINDTNFVLIDSVEFIGVLEDGGSVNLADAFSFSVSPLTPNNHNLLIESEIITDDTTYYHNLFYTVYSAVIQLDNVIVDDGDNHILDPGETTDIILEIENSGGASAENLSIILTSDDPLVTINNVTGFISDLPIDMISPVIFNISVDENAQIGHIIEFALDISSDNGYVSSDSFSLSINFTTEDFESGYFDHFPWGFIGDKEWVITGDNVYEGNFSAHSGNISYNQESSLIIDINVEENSEFSFYRKVSCQNYINNDDEDFLAFLIDDVEQDKWDGQIDWGEETYSVSAGNHRFEWRFQNDHNTTSLYNRAWIDNVAFPSGSYITHRLNFNQEEINQEMEPETTKTDTIIISNPGNFGNVDYRILIDNSIQQEANRSIGGSYLECSDKYLITGQNFEWTFLTRNMSQDDEWIKDILMDFPEGIIIDSVTNFVGGSLGDLEDDSSTGNGVTVSWHGENDDGWGVVKGFEMAEATVYGHSEATFTEDFSIACEIHGDIYGAEPHALYFDIEFINLGESNNWVTLETLDGSIGSNTTETVILNFNSMGLPEGEYFCEFIINDNFNNETIIPISLLVDISVGEEEIAGLLDNNLKIYPNPFNSDIHLEFDSKAGQAVFIELNNTLGLRMGEWNVDIVVDGKQSLTINTMVPKGIYFLTLNIGNKKVSRKIIKL